MNLVVFFSTWMCKDVYVISRETMLRVYLCRAWIIEVGLLFDAFRTIHLFTVSLVSLCLNTFLTFQRLHSIQKSAKSKRERVFFFTPTATADTQWSLESYLGLWGRGGGNNGLYCPSSIGIQWRSVCLFLWTTVSCGRTVVVRLTRSDAKSSQVLDTEQKSPQGRHIKKTSPKKTAYMLL